MKFKSIKLHNFMRYKGETAISFSTDPEKNVTIILGDNTFGKTTLAQAFRWCLYNDMLDTSYDKRKDVVLLNKEVVGNMGTSTEQVWVELTVLEDGKEYVFKRTQCFRRKYPKTDNLGLNEIYSDFTMQINENGGRGAVVPNTKGTVDTVIASMFPQSLSNYLFFDGERWSDEKNKKNDIKESINTITGLSGTIAMARHIKEARYNAKGILESKRVDTGDEMKRLNTRIEANSKLAADKRDEADKLREKIDELKVNVDSLKRKLDENITMEKDQKDLDRIENEINKAKKSKETAYNAIIRKVSDSADFIGAGLYDEIKEMLKTVDLNGKDIPGVTVNTIDYLCRLGECLCGAKINVKERNETYLRLEELKKVIPPAMIGGMVGRFEGKLETWKNVTRNFDRDLVSAAEMYRDCQDTLDDKEEEKSRIESRIDRRLNLAQIRADYNQNNTELEKMNAVYNQLLGQITMAEGKRDQDLEAVRALSMKSSDNKKVERAIGYVTKLYEYASAIISTRQHEIMDKLNEYVKDNFDRMFNGKEKYAALGNDYKIHVFYRNLDGKSDVEEKVLSNGEIIAVNFVFIVSILELAKDCKKDEDEAKAAASTDGDTDMMMEGIENEVDEEILQLPLVLDAPFSNLSKENTSLIANKLPEFAEQIIIFMLDKDWEASGLSRNVMPGYCYHVKKDAGSNSSTIVLDGGND